MKLVGNLPDQGMVLHDGSAIEYMKDLTQRTVEENPFFVMNTTDVLLKMRNWQILMPRVQPFYAVKCNNEPVLLEVLRDLGIGFDCATKTEIRTMLEMGVDQSKIIYAHPCKPVSHLKFAAANGVDLMTFDCEAELYKIKEIMPHARLVLRIRCDALEAQAPLGMKFGAMTEDAPGLLDIAKKLDLTIAGVSFHVGSGCREPAVFGRAIHEARKVFDYAMELGFNPYLLDIGGGFPGDSNSSLDECASYVNPALEKFFPKNLGITIIAEPGRYVASSAFTLATQVVSKKEKVTEDGLACMYFINDGIYGSFNCVIFDHQIVAPTLLNDECPSKSFCSSIWGPTCDGMDKVMDNIYLPHIKVGDWMCWKDMGAYTLAAASNFNGMPLPEVYPYICSENVCLLRKGISYTDLPNVSIA